MISVKYNLLTILFIVIVTGISLFVLLQRNEYLNKDALSYSPLPAISPTIASNYLGLVEATNSLSPDGTKVLTVKKQRNKENTSYSYYVSNKPEDLGSLVFEKKINTGFEMSLPYNTWSPDNTYIFLKETTPITVNYYLIDATKQQDPKDFDIVNIQDLFLQKLPEYSLTDITGWAAPNLLILNTQTSRGEQGPSFWFEVPSQSFIQLSTLFD